jgi:hypothetical protein
MHSVTPMTSHQHRPVKRGPGSSVLQVHGVVVRYSALVVLIGVARERRALYGWLLEREEHCTVGCRKCARCIDRGC